jgi:hypothetical protein
MPVFVLVFRRSLLFSRVMGVTGLLSLMCVICFLTLMRVAGLGLVLDVFRVCRRLLGRRAEGQKD